MSESSTTGELVLVHSARQLLTLRGPAGPRRGSDMQDLGIIPEGAVLIRGGVIEDVGPTRRVANLVRAKRAREIDATGRVVIPGFVDPDAPLITRALSTGQRVWAEKGPAPVESLRVMSRRRMETRCASMAQTLASYGVAVAGASTVSADDPRNVIRILAVQKEMTDLPVRVRSVLTWPGKDAAGEESENSLEWLNAIRRRDLAGMVEFETADADFDRVLRPAELAMQRGFAVRFRSHGALEEKTVQLALQCGAIALHGLPPAAESILNDLARTNCVFVAPCAQLIERNPGSAEMVGAAIERGLAVALSSAFRTGAPGSLNMQYNLQLACSRLKLSPEQAITAATHNAAASLCLSDCAGSLAPGSPADLVIMDVPEYHQMFLRAGHHDVLTVMRAGRIVYRRPSLTLD